MADRLLIFDDLYELVDAVMLFGGSLSTSSGPVPLATIGVARSESQWPVLWWMKLLLEVHGIRMHLAVGERTIDSKLGYKSRGNIFLTPAYRRWYPAPPGAVTPADLQLSQNTLAVWLASALSTAGGKLPARLTAPRMSEAVARGLCRQIRALGWHCHVVPTSRFRAIELAESNSPALTDWLGSIVPPSVWNPRHDPDQDSTTRE